MKRITMLAAGITASLAVFAQNDSTSKDQADTIKVGNMIIIKKHTPGNNRNPDKTVVVERKLKKPSRISTNYLILDLGFANVKDDTQYPYLSAGSGQSFTKGDLKLKTWKSSNVNLWFFMQRLNITKGVLNLKYGLGLEMFNFRYENNISYHKGSPAYIFRDSVNFSKNKLYAGYLSVPFMLNINTSPGKKEGLTFSAGVSAGYLIGSRNKQISNERGKVKLKGDLDLEKFRLAYIGELGLGPVRLFGSYSITTLHENGLKQHPYSLGFRLSNW
jgi:hypothetical protein